MGKVFMGVLVVGALVAGGVYLGRSGIGPLASAEDRACARLQSLCGEGEGKGKAESCRETLRSVRKVAGDEGMEKTAKCLGDAGTCGAAAGCLVGGVGTAVMGEFLKGLQQAVEKK
jgi:hypothetical protein